MVGYVSEAGVKTQTPDVIDNMRLAYALVVCGGVGLAALITLLIPLSKQRMERVRDELAERRAAA